MSKPSKAKAGNVIVTVNGEEFFAFARALKRSNPATTLGDVVFSLRTGELVIETKRGGCVLACDAPRELTARVSGGNFLRLVSLTNDPKFSGSLAITFRPRLGEIALPHAGAKAGFSGLV